MEKKPITCCPTEMMQIIKHLAQMAGCCKSILLKGGRNQEKRSPTNQMGTVTPGSSIVVNWILPKDRQHKSKNLDGLSINDYEYFYIKQLVILEQIVSDSSIHSISKYPHQQYQQLDAVLFVLFFLFSGYLVALAFTLNQLLTLRLDKTTLELLFHKNMNLIQFCVGFFIIKLISGCNDNFEDIQWIHIKDFESSGTKTYHICRGLNQELNCVGTYVSETTKICHAICSDEPAELKEFEILQCAQSGIWTPVYDNNIPKNSYNFVDYEIQPTFACRGVEGNQTIGVVRKAKCDRKKCVEKFICEIVVLDKLSNSKTEQWDRFTIFTITNTNIETNIDKDSDNIIIPDYVQSRIFSFNLKAKEEVVLYLKTESGTTLFEILIGGLKNSITGIRKGASYVMYSNTTHTLNILKEKEFIGFWVYWGQGTLIFGKGDKYLEPQSEHQTSIISLQDSGVFGITKYLMKSSSPAVWNSLVSSSHLVWGQPHPLSPPGFLELTLFAGKFGSILSTCPC
uniref:Farnesoic acid O-methyl transferase domain-containing protein n=1 Tax=Megaselia scalaris TaxID=36166 RepID=T1GEH0_MEGSC